LGKVSAAVGVTKNLGNFESLRLDYSLESDIRPGEKPDEALQRVHKEVYAFLEKKIKEETE
jgi:hypothetical protein